MYITLNNRSVTLVRPLMNVKKCSMIGCTFFRKDENVDQRVFAVCCNFIISRDDIPLLGLVVYDDERKDTIHKVAVNPPSYDVITSSIKSINIRIYDWETLQDISDQFEEKCHIDLLFS